MPANTPHGYPYPLGTDRVADGDNDIQALATAVDTKLGIGMAGTNTVTISAAPSGSLAVTFPVGRFTSVPAVVASSSGTSTYIANVSTVSATGFTLNVFHRDGTSSSTSIPAHWIARTVG